VKLKTEEIVAYIRGKYFTDTNYPINEEAEKVINDCYEARDAFLRISEDYDLRKQILVEINYSKNVLALYRAIAPDPGAWETFIVDLKSNGISARDLQSIRSVVNAAYKELLKETEQEILEETNVTVIERVKSFTAENSNSGIILKITLLGE